MEVDPGGGSVRRAGDAEVHADLEAGYLRPVHRLPGLLRVLDSLKVNEGKSSGPFGRAVQHDLDFLKFAESAELSLQISLCGGEIESKHPDTVGWFGILTITINLINMDDSLLWILENLP